MRISPEVAEKIADITREIFGPEANVRLFGSRLNDELRGGDVDLLVETPNSVESPALLPARLEARVSRLMHGRKVDVLLCAPNLQIQDIHRVAREQGVLL
jgi:predicted nucleotidyltransferase